MSSKEFTEWKAFYSVEPWGFEAEEWRSALLATISANANRDRKKYPRPFEIRDFYRNFKQQRRYLTPEELIAYSKQYFRVMGAKRL